MHYLAVDREREGVELVGIVLEEAAEGLEQEVVAAWEGVELVGIVLEEAAEGLEQEVVAAWEGVDEKAGLDLSTHMSTCHTL